MSEPLPRIGVVVLNWNGLKHLQRLLPTLRVSEHPDFFVIVVDNASTDGSVEWLREQPEETLSLTQNLRFAGGNNAGARRALERGAQIVLLLNNDTVVEPTMLMELARPFAHEPGLGVAGPRIVYLHEPQRIWYGGGIFDGRWGIVQHRALRRRVDEEVDPAGPTEWVSGCALAIRAELWLSLGGLDESYYIYAEDVDLCLRARARGWSMRYVPSAKLAHAVSASVGGPWSAFKAYHKTRSRLQLLQRHGQGPIWKVSLLTQDLAMALWLLLRSGREVAGAVQQAWADRDGRRNRYPALGTTLPGDGSCPPPERRSS